MPSPPILGNILVRDLCSILFNKKRNPVEEFSDPTPYISFALSSKSALYWTVANASQQMHVIFDKQKVYVDCCSPDVKLMFDRGFELFHGYARSAVFFDIGKTEEDVAALMKQFYAFKSWLNICGFRNIGENSIISLLAAKSRRKSYYNSRRFCANWPSFIADQAFFPRKPIKFANLTELVLFEENPPVFALFAKHEYPALEKLDVSFYLVTGQLSRTIESSKVPNLKSVSINMKSDKEFDAAFVGEIEKFVKNFHPVPEFMFKLTCQPQTVDIAVANETHAAFAAAEFGAHVQLDVFQRSFKLLHRSQLAGSDFVAFDHGWMYSSEVPGKYICHTIDNLMGLLVAEANNLDHGDDEDATCAII